MSAFLTVAECLFSNTWRLLCGVNVPGFDNISAAAFMSGTLMIFLSIGVLKRILGGNKK